jgi:hypothetical protein
MGSFRDPDSPGGDEVPSFDLFMRLFTGGRYDANLYGDISTLTHVHHGPRPLRQLLTAPELHGRLLYGTDYPLPALRFMMIPVKLELDGLIERADRKLCDRLFDVNPLLFDFAINRSLRVIEDGRTHRFPAAVFETTRHFDDLSRPPSPAADA